MGLKQRATGVYSTKNKLNELTGKQWLKFTKSWFIHNPPARADDEILHPAKFPESLVHQFIEFFTKRGMTVLDPFLGTGSTLIAARSCGRNGVGIELIPKYARIAQLRVNNINLAIFETDTKQIVIQGDATELIELLKQYNIHEVDYCITSPPYWNQLKRTSLRQQNRIAQGLDTQYSNDIRDLGNLDDYTEFLAAQRKVFEQVYQVMKPLGYLTIITNNIYFEGRLYPLAFDTLSSLSDIWVPKDEKIWLQNDKKLLALGINNAWVGNRHHQYCLIFRKE